MSHSPSVSSSSSLRKSLSLAALTLGASVSLYLGLRAWRRHREAASLMRAVDEHSMPLPMRYEASFDYSNFDILVLFPSTVEAQREKHYAVMSAEQLPGAQNLLLEPQDAQKKACTYGLDDSETELLASLHLLRPKSIQFIHVSLDSYTQLFDGWDQKRKDATLVLNLCDGTELDDIPGLSVLRHLSASGVAYTGADSAFFVVSTYKVRMKRLFDARRVKTAPWMLLEKEIIEEWKKWRDQEPTQAEEEQKQPIAAASNSDLPAHALISRPSPFVSQFSPALSSALSSLSSLPYPLLVKPDDSYCSCGITTRSVVFSSEAALDMATSLGEQFSAVFVEEFVKGREFTVFIAGDAREGREQGQQTWPTDLSLLPLSSLTRSLRCLLPIERAFDQALPFYEQFISYELFWEIARTTPGKDEFLFIPVSNQERMEVEREEGRKENISLSQALQEEALRAYISVGGCGYSRVDMRFDTKTRQIAVLEVNANCGITQYKQTAMGEILRESKTGFYQVLDGFFADALKARNANQTSK